MALISLKDIRHAFTGPVLLDGIDLQIEPGERIGLVGRNGCGKSTLLRIIQGEIVPDDGEIARRREVRIAGLAQEVPDSLAGTIDDGLRAALRGSDVEDWEVEQRIDQVSKLLLLDGTAAADSLSAGTARRLLLGQALVAEPDVLVLDEPTNHLDIEAIDRLEEDLLRREGALIFVTHDRRFLARLATRILDLDRGVLRSYSCDYEKYLERKEHDIEAEAEQSKQFDKKLAQEEVWIRRGLKARRKRNQGRVRALEGLRDERRARRDVVGSVRAQVQEAEKTGRVVMKVRDLGHSFDDTPVFDGLTTTIMRGDRIGIIGPNGCGKSTLICLLLDELEPTTGSIEYGTNLEIARFDQLHDVLDDSKTVQDNVGDGSDKIVVNGQSRHVIGYLQDFLFTPEQVRGPITKLSGGERNRLQLARILSRPCNVLVLDEPTNDLDLETLEILEDLLVDFAGTLLLVSHDRAFIDNAVTSTLVFEGEGQVKEYFGGYADWVRQRSQSGDGSGNTSNDDAKSTKKGGTGKDKKSRPKKDKPRKLTFKEQGELEALPARLEELEEKKDAIVTAMSDPAFFKQPGDVIAAETEKLDVVERELTETYERWELLEGIAEGAG